MDAAVTAVQQGGGGGWRGGGWCEGGGRVDVGAIYLAVRE